MEGYRTHAAIAVLDLTLNSADSEKNDTIYMTCLSCSKAAYNHTYDRFYSEQEGNLRSSCTRLGNGAGSISGIHAIVAGGSLVLTVMAMAVVV